MDKRGTGGQPWKLKSGSNDNPSLTLGKTTAWQLNDLPDRCPTGPLANYLPGLFLTIKGNLVQPSEGGTNVPRDVLPSLLIESTDWTNAFHGAPVSGDHVKGKFLPIVEFLGGGFQYGQRQINEISSVAGAHQFSCTVFIPACDRRGRLIRKTSQLALLYQPSQLKLNVAAASILTDWSTGATFTNLSATLTAPLVPRQEIMFATGVEWILHEVAAATNGQSVKINGFGRDTMFTGVENKGGVMTLGELTNEYIQGGVFAGQQVEQISFPWRGLQQLDDIDAYIAMFENQLPNDRPQQTAQGAQGTPDRTNDWSTFPRTNISLDSTNLNPMGYGLRLFPLVMGGDELELTELQTANRDETYFLKVAGGFDAGDHLILGQYARIWQEGKRASFEALVRDGGPNSLAAYVFGNGYESRKLRQVAPNDHYVVTTDQLAYCPWALV